MSRVLSDKTIVQLARDGCNITDNGMYNEIMRGVECNTSLPTPSLLPLYRHSPAKLAEVASGPHSAVWEPDPDDNRGTEGWAVPYAPTEEGNKVLSRGTLGVSEVRSGMAQMNLS